MSGNAEKYYKKSSHDRFFKKGFMILAESTAMENISLVFIDKYVMSMQKCIKTKIVDPWTQSNPNESFRGLGSLTTYGIKTILNFHDTHMPGYLTKDKCPLKRS